MLSKALTGHYKVETFTHYKSTITKALECQHVRLYATTHLGELIRRTGNATAWTLRLLLTQLYDPAIEVCEAAVRYLEEACGDSAVLQLVVHMRPTWEHLGPVGHPLLLKCVYRYLHARSGH